MKRCPFFKYLYNRLLKLRICKAVLKNFKIRKKGATKLLESRLFYRPASVGYPLKLGKKQTRQDREKKNKKDNRNVACTNSVEYTRKRKGFSNIHEESFYFACSHDFHDLQPFRFPVVLFSFLLLS